MSTTEATAKAEWRANDLKRDQSWVFKLDDTMSGHLESMVKAVFSADRPLFDYSREEFDLGPARETLLAAKTEAMHGRGLALVQALPRENMSEKEFELLNWAIGLHYGVARPQGKASQYLSAVRDAGTNYRSASGRGYSSNAKLDFHADGCDMVTLGCYNKARSGGQSMISSGVTTRSILMQERPDLAAVAHQDFYFSRQNEEAPDEAPYYGQPLFDLADGRVFCKWNRNRVQSAQKIDGVPPLSDAQRATMDALDEILQRPDVMFTMYMEPGDLQIMNNHVLLHSRTDFEDFEKPEQKRLLCRVWLATPDGPLLPQSWSHFFRTATPGAVRGGIRGHNHNEECKAFERKQATSLGMTVVD
jgi:hypothetical protein